MFAFLGVCGQAQYHTYCFPHNVAINTCTHRAAMQHMGNSIDANGLTGLQKIWGGTHDAILGMLLWKYAIPTYSLNK